jgi:hypothetical protein
MGEVDQEVFMNRNKNARPNEWGNYFGAMPKVISRKGSPLAPALCLPAWTSPRWGEAMAMRDVLFKKSPKRPCKKGLWNSYPFVALS